MAAEKVIQPLISVIIPVYNGAQYLSEAIGSIVATAYPRLEIIVIDDGSTDSSAESAKSFGPPVKYHYQSNKGCGAARNLGIELAVGEYISFLDQDDYCPEDKFEVLLAEIVRTNALIVMGKTQYVFENESARKRWPTIPSDGVIFNQLLGAGLFRREVFTPSFNGLFVPEIAPSEDTEWFNRLKTNKIDINRLEDITLFYRQHDRNVGNQERYYYRGIVSSMKYIIDQKRK